MVIRKKSTNTIQATITHGLTGTGQKAFLEHLLGATTSPARQATILFRLSCRLVIPPNEGDLGTATHAKSPIWRLPMTPIDATP